VARRQRRHRGRAGGGARHHRARRAEAALVRSERTLAEFFENAEAEFFEKPPWACTGSAPTHRPPPTGELDLLGYAREESSAPHRGVHVDPEVITEILARSAAASGGRLGGADARQGRLDQARADLVQRPLGGRPLRPHALLTRDITDRRRMEEHTAGGPAAPRGEPARPRRAHEINNPLAVIYGSSTSSPARGGETKPRITACREAIARIAEILDRMEQPRPTPALAGWPADLPPCSISRHRAGARRHAR